MKNITLHLIRKIWWWEKYPQPNSEFSQVYLDLPGSEKLKLQKIDSIVLFGVYYPTELALLELNLPPSSTTRKLT